MIIVRSSGGLGNQMFQYALGRSLANLLKDDLKFDLAWHDKPGSRPYELSAFSLCTAKADREAVIRVRGPKTFLKDFLFNRLKINLYPHGYIKETGINFDPRIFTFDGDMYLDGFWQSERYFKDIETTLRQDFVFKAALSDDDTSWQDQMDLSESVAVHVRRGDYISNPHTKAFHGVLDADYYVRAIASMQTALKSPRFFIFTDDIDWCRSCGFFPASTVFVTQDVPRKAWEDLRLMSRCRHHIIANSSFSWWGAWLGKNPHQIVIGPKRWFHYAAYNIKDRFPEGWRVI